MANVWKRKAGAEPKRQARAIDPARLTRQQLVEVLKAAGAPATATDIEKFQQAGAPLNADGTYHLIHLAAWLASQAD